MGVDRVWATKMKEKNNKKYLISLLSKIDESRVVTSILQKEDQRKPSNESEKRIHSNLLFYFFFWFRI